MSGKRYCLYRYSCVVRTNIDARAMSELMMEYQIPFVMKEHLNNIYEHFIAQDISSYFHLSQGEYSRKYFLQIANRPNRFFSRDSMKGGTVTYDSLREYYRDKNWMTDRVDQLEWDMKMIKDKTPYAAIQYIRKHMGYDEFLKDYAAYRKISVEDLFAVLEEIWQNSKGYRTIGDWFEHVERYGEILKEQNCKKNAAEGVNLMTMHAAKGLEFDTVFIIGVNPGLLPIRCSSFDQEEEERRLFFVGITRARNHLELSYYTNPGEPGVSGSYSNYLKMIPEELLEWKEIRSDEEKRTNLKELTRRAKEEIRKAEAQHFKREPQKAGKLRGKRYGSGEKDITPLADVPVLFKAVPELQQEKFYSD